jgi:hypothetical protein
MLKGVFGVFVGLVAGALAFVAMSYAVAAAQTGFAAIPSAEDWAATLDAVVQRPQTLLIAAAPALVIATWAATQASGKQVPPGLVLGIAAALAWQQFGQTLEPLGGPAWAVYVGIALLTWAGIRIARR